MHQESLQDFKPLYQSWPPEYQTIVQASDFEESAEKLWRDDSWFDLTAFPLHSMHLGFGDRQIVTHCIRAGIVDVCLNMNKMQLPATTSAEPMDRHPWAVLSV